MLKRIACHPPYSRLSLFSFTLLTFFLSWEGTKCHGVKLNVFSNGTKGLGESLSVICKTNESSASLRWTKGDSDADLPITNKDAQHEAILGFANLTLEDIDLYTCHAKLTSGDRLNSSYDLSFRVNVQMSMKGEHVVLEGSSADLTCSAKGYPVPSVIFWGFGTHNVTNSSNQLIHLTLKNRVEISSTLHILNATSTLNGSYTCKTADGILETHLIVKSKPTIRIALLRAVGKSQIYCRWILTDGNSKVNSLVMKYSQEGEDIPKVVDLNATTNYYILDALTPETIYRDFSITATNDVGSRSDNSMESLLTLREDPVFVPTKVFVKGSTSDTVTLGWDVYQNLSDHYTHYKVISRTIHGKNQTHTALNPPLMVDKLRLGTNYFFQVQACSNYTDKCDDPSKEVSGATMEGRSGPPRNLTMHCHFDNKTGESTVDVQWEDPAEPNGNIVDYSIELNGKASFYNENGRQTEIKVVSVTKDVASKDKRVNFPHQPPNTHLYVQVCAKTRTKICGAYTESSCNTPVTLPDLDKLSSGNWKAVGKKGSQKIFFMVTLPVVSQRNGPICCFRVVVVRLQKEQSINDIKPPAEQHISTYDEVHNGTNGGAYIADILEISSHNTIIGDGITQSEEKRPFCKECWSHEDMNKMSASYRPSEQYSTKHRKRHANPNNQVHTNAPKINPRDGPLNSESTYTAFLEAIVINEKRERMFAQSRYFTPLRPVIVESPDPMIPEIAIIGSLVVAVVVVSVALLCVMRCRRKEPGDQEYGLSHSLQQWCRRLRGQQPIPSEEPPNLPPISKEDIVDAYIERHKDSDLGFQQEFEKLPDRFSDRTSVASDMRDNAAKNRYPDIKAYDQTRVKLYILDGGSDYINANVVAGYKERKKFVCAQGPMESTVVDWWRMIWEQNVHFILMLTNVEEYNKTKCAKYWPSEGATNYGDFLVTHSSEKRYSDYLVRNLKLSKARSGSSSLEDGVKEERDILQYHYLVWKDFMAPEYPVGILRFIKRFNEVYGPDKGPILVHCSAGVGRTGTLVALDSMLQQLNEEGCASIFNTICDLRHQRNYLVQSLKQYTFIYRALMEYSQFGDTDVSAPELKSQIEKLKGCSNGSSTSRMQEEYERLVQVIEDRKPFTVGAAEENRHRNRHANVVPYDRSRVHLSPMPGLNKEINTYINASFIEGYDNTEQFIIAQDPLEVTIGDFWRMIVEQNIRIIVMLSETGEEKCPRYWPEKDQETSHDYIKVKYMQTQSFPFYYRREFTVTDTKTDSSCLVTQFQYNGWPVGEGEVPQADRGIVELIDTTFKYRETLDKNVGPMVVHCSDGADRSCIFVALGILAQMLMNESRVDVFSVVRKLRSQRQGLFRNFAQYEFIYRGLVTYAELHVANGNAGH